MPPTHSGGSARARRGTGTLDALVLDDALARLAELDERQAQMVELRFFGGLSCASVRECARVCASVRECARVPGVLSERTVKGDRQIARAWLRRELGGASA